MLAAAATLVGGLIAFGSSSAHAAPTILPPGCSASAGELPDLCPSLPSAAIDGGAGPFLEVLADSSRRYRFDAVIWNARGAFELEGQACSAAVCNQVVQRVHLGDGEPGGAFEDRSIPGRIIADVGDGHAHFHFEHAARHELIVPNGENYISRRVGFCMSDSFADPAGAAPGFYTADCPLDGTTVGMGISRDWGDNSTAVLTHQWIVVDGLEPGTYTLRAEVNPGREFIEADYANNVLEVTRAIPGATAADAASVTAAGSSVDVSLAGTVAGSSVEVRYDGGATHSSAGPALAFELVTSPTRGTLSAIAATSPTTAQVIYTPNPGFSGTDTFTYRTRDDRGLASSLATASVTVGTPPAAPPAASTVSCVPGLSQTSVAKRVPAQVLAHFVTTKPNRALTTRRLSRRTAPAHVVVHVKAARQTVAVARSLRSFGERTALTPQLGLVGLRANTPADLVAHAGSDPRIAFVELDRKTELLADQFDAATRQRVEATCGRTTPLTATGHLRVPVADRPMPSL